MMINSEQVNAHRREFHSLVVCDQCGVSIEAFKLPEHKKTLCSKRILMCKYCKAPKMAMEMSDHENYCGSRTERCDKCPDWVQLREWDSHQNRYHSNMNRRFRERSVIAQTETIIDYNASKIQSEESTNDPMLPCEFCDGLVPMRKLLEHQAACVNPTNVRRGDNSPSPNISATSSFRKSEKPKIHVSPKKLSCSEQMALESPMPSPQMTKKTNDVVSQRKISAPANLENCQSKEVEETKMKVPCEFCNEPCSLDALMRHQRACKHNPHINHAETEAPTAPYRRSRHYSLSRTQSVRDSSEIERPLRALSRQNSFSDRSYLRRSESFYGSRSTMTLGRSTYSSTDYASAVRRSSLFDGYAGFSIYSSISQGLDEITYGGRRSRRGSLSTSTAVDSTYAFTSRRGSVTANSVDYAALMAATAALEAVSSTNKDKKKEVEETSQAESGLGNSPKSINLSRQNSTRMSNMSDSAYGEDYESAGSPGQPQPTMMPHKIQKSSSLRAPPPKKQQEIKVIKHSKSSGKLERKVSFSEADPIKIESTINLAMESSTNTVTEQPPKPKRSKEKQKETKKLTKVKKDKKDASDSDFVDQVNAKLMVLEQKQKAAEVIEVIDHPNSMDISATIKLSPKQRPKSQASNPSTNPGMNSILQDLVAPGAENQTPKVNRREPKQNNSRMASKRNSLDKQSVQTLAQDLAAECAKAYALMESSLSKLSSELGVTPFGLAPKNKKLRKSSSTTAACTTSTTARLPDAATTAAV